MERDIGRQCSESDNYDMSNEISENVKMKDDIDAPQKPKEIRDKNNT